MITEKFKERINYLKNNHLIVEALYEILDELKLKHNAFTGFTFREEIDPKGFLLTAEGEEKTGITIRVPRNILDFDLVLLSNVLMHEMVHVFQRSGENQIELREEREWQAYTEMIFHKQFPNVPPLTNFYIKQFGEKALTYYNRMPDNMKTKYANEKTDLEKILQTIYDKENKLKEEPKPENNTETISWKDFEKVDMRIGTIISANDFPKARNPAYQLEIDFGPLGIKKSSAQITSLYNKEELIGKQIMAVSSMTLVSIIKDSAMIIGLIVVMFVSSWKITILVFLMAPILYCVLRYVSKRLRGIARRVQGHMGEFNHILEEGIRGQKEIKLFNAYARMDQQFSKVNTDLRHLNMKSLVASQIASPISQVFLVLFIAVVIWYASSQASADEITIGSFLSLLAAMVGMLTPIKRLVSMNDALQKGAAGAESVFKILDAESELDKGTAQLGSIEGSIEFKDVKFSYEGSNEHAIKGISLKISPKETVALVGASGSGKSTFANLLSRFYLPTEGEISLDGHNINDINLDNYRSHIGYVGQNVILFADTIANNIGFGGQSVTREEIEQAAKYANASDFIEALPNGYDTIIGENGTKLSGGQRQRIAIARALLKDAPILIFDEATSSLDNESEYAIQKALKVLSAEKTTIIIAHRLSTIEHADKIVVFSHGEIVEVGDHRSLLEKNGYYAKLYRVDKDELS